VVSLTAGFGRKVGKLVKQRYMLSIMCGCSAYKLRQEGIVPLYRLTLSKRRHGDRGKLPEVAASIIAD
jgi:hypothetical protein